jgi:hypothetical protein
MGIPLKANTTSYSEDQLIMGSTSCKAAKIDSCTLAAS